MKKAILYAAIAATAIPVVAMPAAAMGASKVNATVVERNAKGRATKVEVDGKVYAVCEGSVQDECINPRQAGLNFGNVPLNYWPGEAASEES